MPKQRTSKYKRIQSKESLPAHRWLPADTLILQKAGEYRYITTAMLQAITGLSRYVVNERTKKLFHHGYLGRRHLAHPQNGGGSNPSIHVLDEKGRRWLSQNESLAERHLRSLVPSTTHSPTAERELEHNLLCSHVHAFIESACNTTPNLRLDFWHNESQRYYTNVSENGLTHPVRPDAFSQISILQDGDWTPHPILWEFDRSTMSHKTMRRKYRAYFILWRDHLRPSGTLNEFDNINRFRVTTVTAKPTLAQNGNTQARIDNLLQDAYRSDDRRIGSKLFLFTRHEDLPLNTPSDILNPIWHVGDKREDHQYPLLQ